MPTPSSTPGKTLNVAVLGLGQMGLVSASLLVSPDRARGTGELPFPRVTMWGHDLEEAGTLSQSRRSDRLPGFTLPPPIRVAMKDRDIAGADLVVCAIPVQFIRETLRRLHPHLAPAAAFVSVAKGIENCTLMRPSEIILDVAGPRPIGVLSGPTIAAELARCLPATMVSASSDPVLAELVQRLFSTTWLRIYTHHDMLGVELAGATKNIIGIAAGILDGLQAGNNAKSALLARGLAEITRLGTALGAQRETFFGVAGVGDLATTCFSPEGRNRSCGEALGRGEKLDAYLKRSRHVVEGVWTTKSVMDLAARHIVEMPITEAVHAVLFEGLDPLEAISRLMARELKGERVG
ncbi:MAG: NAD(P)-dependent glycerol-3-phosphate dehydrogenase [Phycisphaeraceae bacterium]|nr:NAD(P)-dependent glycerol-3-phosphate dehydrogenase [Phycisphaeraceae bacterium]MCW5755526.1 NAD(P)-dependent glycerol-3-phosphate dehydrogenase [Phycisphaeraceae bacterium]